MKNAWLAAPLLGLCVVRHYGWLAWAIEDRGTASKMLGSVAALGLLAIILHLVWERVNFLLGAVFAAYAFEELQTVLWTIAYMHEPWEVAPGQSLGSSRIEFDIGAASLLGLAWLAWKLAAPVNYDSTAEKERAGQ